ncbi:MAG TPA: hypothetical protein VHO47_03275 [Candidatus Babeliales bacterium]|nr:hypothetical protein [Candidatus Babeliales bacterium]
MKLLSNSNKYYFNKLSYETIFNTTLHFSQSDHKEIGPSDGLQSHVRYDILNKNGINQSEHPSASMISTVTISEPIEESEATFTYDWGPDWNI